MITEKLTILNYINEHDKISDIDLINNFLNTYDSIFLKEITNSLASDGYIQIINVIHKTISREGYHITISGKEALMLNQKSIDDNKQLNWSTKANIVTAFSATATAIITLMAFLRHFSL